MDKTITTTVKELDNDRVETAFDKTYSGRTSEDAAGKVTENYTKAEWVAKTLQDFVDNVTKSYEANKAAKDARDAKQDTFTSVVK